MMQTIQAMVLPMTTFVFFVLRKGRGSIMLSMLAIKKGKAEGKG